MFRNAKLPRFLINPNKIPPYDTIGVGDWVVFNLCDGDCEIGEIIRFDTDCDKPGELTAIIRTPDGNIKSRNIFLDLSDRTLFKVDHYHAQNIKRIQED